MTRFRLDPPDDDGPEPDRCDCGAELAEYTGPDGECEQVCPVCDINMELISGDPSVPRGDAAADEAEHPCD